MSGFGFKEAHTGLAMTEAGHSWRPEAFCHQLSQNGSLMLAPNHDELWLEAVTSVLGQPAGVSWEYLTGVLRSLPAHRSRKALWEASHRWWLIRRHWRHDALTKAGELGCAEAFLEHPSLRTLDVALNLRQQQLHTLVWCLADRTEDTIGVVEEEMLALPSPRKRRRKQ